MFMDESITSVTVNMLAKEFVLHSDTGKELVIDCESFEQFMNVYNMVIKFKDYYDVEYHGFETNIFT